MTFPLLTGRASLLNLRGVRVGRGRLPERRGARPRGRGCGSGGEYRGVDARGLHGGAVKEAAVRNDDDDHFFVTLGGHSAAAGYGERREPPCPKSTEMMLDFDRRTNAKKLCQPLSRRHGTE